MSLAKRLALPQNLAEAADLEGRRRWLVTVLPEVVAQAQKRWSLTVGEPFRPGGQKDRRGPEKDRRGPEKDRRGPEKDRRGPEKIGENRPRGH
jgi:hypothetical protein